MAIVLYARKSVERENSISCETQLEYCKSMLRPEEHDEKIIEIVDNGYSGGNTDREGFQKMMNLVRQGKVGKVIVYRLDRISRSLPDFMNILQEFKAHDVMFVSSQELIDTSSSYGEMIIKIVMVFAEFERQTTIDRVTQAYENRSKRGFYMGGRRPYGFELVPTVIDGVPTKKLDPVPSEAEQIHYIFEVYSQEGVSLRRLMDTLLAEGKQALDGSGWTTAKLSTILKNPIYVRADSDVYDYYERHGTQIVTDVSLFTGENGAQLYGKTKHSSDNPDWSDMKLVLLTHPGIVDSEIWLKCQRKLESNKQINNSLSNSTSWLAGKVVCEQCGHTMTTVKSKPDKNGEIRRYFNCTGRSHKKSCPGPGVTIYAEDLENMVYDCIAEKLADLKGSARRARKSEPAEVNDLKLRLKAIEQEEERLLEGMLSGGFNDDLLAVANRKATQLKTDRLALNERLEQLSSRDSQKEAVINLARSWKNADYQRKKAVALLMIHKIVISQDGSVSILWNI